MFLMRVGNNSSQHVLIMSTFCSALISVLIIYHSGLANTFFFSSSLASYLNRKHKPYSFYTCLLKKFGNVEEEWAQHTVVFGVRRRRNRRVFFGGFLLTEYFSEAMPAEIISS